jgi:tRNA 2-thiocytidine biosynthesis protein TtcA
MIQFDMIQDGDRLLLGLSGGKDSLSLLHILLEWRRKSPKKFDIEVCTIDPMTPSFDPSPLIPYVEGLGLKYHYIRDDSELAFVIAENSTYLLFMFFLVSPHGIA